MESWRGFVNEDEDFGACPVPTVDVDQFLDGLELAMMEPEAQKDYIEKLKGSRTRVKNLNRIIEIGGFLTGLVAVGTGGSALVGAGFVSIVANLWRSRQETQSDKKTNAIMKMLCIDAALLDTIDNDVETLYWTNSGLRDEIEAYIATARASQSPDPMPNFTAHLVDWLNTKDPSPYAKSGTTGPDTDIVAR